MSNIKTLKPFGPAYDPRRNTKGRPKGSKNWRTLIMRVLKKKVRVGDKMMRMDDVMIEQIFRKAMRGNLKAMKIIIDRVDGKVPDEMKWPEPKSDKVEITSEEEAELERLFGRKDNGQS